MRGVLRILQSQGVQRVVLGAWGCGAYGNPVGEIARAWKDTIFGAPQLTSKRQQKDQERWFGLREVVFAIAQRPMATEFVRHWGNDIDFIQLSEAAYDEEDDEANEQESQDVMELREKIAQLDVQIAGARHETLRSSLGVIRDKLATDLAARVGDSASESNEEVEDRSTADS
jgi:hypothetical protein